MSKRFPAIGVSASGLGLGMSSLAPPEPHRPQSKSNTMELSSEDSSK